MENEKLYLGMNGKYYQGHELATAYFLDTGNDPDDYNKSRLELWIHDKIGLSICKIVNMNDVSYEEFLAAGQKLLAVRVYRDRNNCTLREAKEAIDEIQKSLESEVDGEC